MPTADFIRQQLTRIGANAEAYQEASPIASLLAAVDAVKSPTFRAVPKLYGQMLADYGIFDLQDLSEEELEEEMPLILGLQFVGEDGFYDGWQDDFSNATSAHTPFAYDEHYYHFLVANESSPGDPSIESIDHETVGEAPEPYYDLTAGKLLASIDRE